MADHRLQQLPLAGHCSELAGLLQLRHPAKDLNIYSRRYSRSHLLGQQKTTQRGRGMEFEEVRQYQPGDDVRTIDWRVTARTQVPHTKLYREERERPVLIICDMRAPMFFGSHTRFKSVQLCNIAALLAWAALGHKDRVGGLLFSGAGHHDLRPARSKHRVMQMLQNLCELSAQQNAPVDQPGDNTMLDILMDTRRVTRPGGAVFILSDFHDFNSDAEAQLHMLARHNDVSCLQLYDPMEASLPELKGLRISDGNHSTLINTSAFGQRHFHSQRQQQQQQLERACARSAVELLPISTADSPQALMLQRFGPGSERRLSKGRPNG
ncbi:MAG: DUF58 domain-containing protein [Cellvibrionaceae bacterium]|nr:DUF58 domain-containing protein [Cellvibrionaceae bacterium]